MGTTKPLDDDSRSDLRLPTAARMRSSTVLAAAVVLGATTLLLAVLVGSGWAPLVTTDDTVRDVLHRFALRHRTYLGAMRALSGVGSALSWQVVTVVVATATLWQRRYRHAAFTVVTIAGSSLLNSALKTAVGRPRPVVPHPFVHLTDLSFPSGHAQAATVGSLVLLLVARPHLRGFSCRLALAAGVLATVAIGYSRAALAAHYVSDVVAGFLVGGAWVALMSVAFGLTTAGASPQDVRAVRTA